MKFNLAVILVAALVYFLIILGSVEQWSSPSLSINYFAGVLVALVTSVFILIASSYSYYRIAYQARYSAQDAFKVTTSTSNAITFISIGIVLGSIMGIILKSLKSSTLDKPASEEINHRAN